MPTIKAKDFVGVSRKTFSDTYRDAIEQARASLGNLESAEVAPPFYVLIAEDGEIEFRSTVRVLYQSEE
jgi:flavin-binding protein dodecin